VKRPEAHGRSTRQRTVANSQPRRPQTAVNADTARISDSSWRLLRCITRVAAEKASAGDAPARAFRAICARNLLRRNRRLSVSQHARTVTERGCSGTGEYSIGRSIFLNAQLAERVSNLQGGESTNCPDNAERDISMFNYSICVTRCVALLIGRAVEISNG